ncbi:hypothetical protein BDP27DRAFT_1424482 [Rhodocollybia butyracea]|uniref:Uncharacterized protein n=1 Tax=Rhodocollybia butyracea TaxID=206335 RepID=A0A9P5PM31_9AGAR|nr:hypothetical protein BDP27DRAFT_1424482 [Rhodocollybia butyracea]
MVRYKRVCKSTAVTEAAHLATTTLFKCVCHLFNSACSGVSFFSLVTLSWAPNVSNVASTSNINNNGLLDAFRAHYEQFQGLLINVYTEETDPFLLQLLGKDLDQFGRTAERAYSIQIFLKQKSFKPYELDGRPAIVFSELTGSRGRPHTVIHPEFLRWAYGHTTTSGLSHFLGIPHRTVRHRLLDLGIALPGVNPVPRHRRSSEDNVDSSDQILDGQTVEPTEVPDNVQAQAATVVSSSSIGYWSTITDDQLDGLINQLHVHSGMGFHFLKG